MSAHGLRALYVEEARYERRLDVTTLRGFRLCGQLSPGDRLRSLSAGTDLEIVSEGFRPGRVGLEGKMISHLTQEGLWAVKGKHVEGIAPGFLVAGDANLTPSTLKVVNPQILMTCAEASVIDTGAPIPVFVEGEGGRLYGIVVVHEGRGSLQLLLPSSRDLPHAEITLRLANEAIWAGPAIRVAVSNE